jgi:predicted nucleic acid-binding protein
VRTVFVDTSAFVALRNRGEREHSSARATLKGLLDEHVRLITSNYVFSETYTALLMRVDHGEALRWGTAFRAGSAVELVRLDEQDEHEAWAILQSHADKKWSHVDATSFAVMGRENTDEAFAFDRHFAQRGFRLHPGG